MPNSTMSAPKAPKKKLNIPAGFKELLEVFARDVLAEQPKDIPSFAIAFFTKAKNEQLKREQEVTNHEDAELLTKTSEKEVEGALRKASAGSCRPENEVVDSKFNRRPSSARLVKKHSAKLERRPSSAKLEKKPSSTLEKRPSSAKLEQKNNSKLERRSSTKLEKTTRSEAERRSSSSASTSSTKEVRQTFV